MGNALGPELARFRKTNTISGCANDGAFAKADCQRLIAESLPKCFGCGYAALCLEAVITKGHCSHDVCLPLPFTNNKVDLCNYCFREIHFGSALVPRSCAQLC